MAGHVRRLNVDTDVGMVTDPTAIGMKGDKGLPETASITITPMDLTSLGASDGTPLWAEMTSHANTPRNSSLPNLPPNQAPRNDAPFPKLFIGALPPLFTSSATTNLSSNFLKYEAAINSSHIQSSSQDSNNIYVEEDEKEQDEVQLVHLPIESRHFDVMYGYAEEEEERMPSSSSSSGTSSPKLLPYVPIIREPILSPDIIPPSSPPSSAKVAAKLVTRL